MIPNLGSVDAKSIGELTDIVARQTKEIQFILEGNIDADNIRANSITANLIAAGSITADKLNVSQLSAITANLGAVTAGTIDGVTITGGTIRTSSSGGRVEMSGSKISVYDPYTSVLTAALTPQAGYNEPGFQLFDKYSGNEALNISKVHSGASDYGVYINTKNANNLTIDVAGNLAIYCAGTTILPSHNQSWSTITGTPTSLSGYGVSSVSWSYLTGTPTTLSSYGITDAYTKIQSDSNYASASHTHSFSSITSKPTTISGYSISDAFTKAETDSRYGYNLVYNSTTKHLKLYAHDGTILADVDITGS